MNFLESIFSLLESNQKFPYYQAERRIDIFLNFFIEDIIRQHSSFKDAEYIAAEFPLKKSLATDHAAHIDYMMVSKECKSVILVELKTDDKSFKAKQIDFYFKHDNFKGWYDEFEKIKMKGFKEKRETLLNVINDNLMDDLECYKINVVVLKPTHTEQDYQNLLDKAAVLKFVALKGLIIKTKFQPEWDSFKKNVLNNM